MVVDAAAVAAVLDGTLGQSSIYSEIETLANIGNGGSPTMQGAVFKDMLRNTGFTAERFNEVLSKFIRTSGIKPDYNKLFYLALEKVCHISDDVAGKAFKAIKDVNAPDENGNTPICAAAAHGRWDFVRKLLSRGAVPDIPGDDGKSALFHAAAHHEDKMVDALLKAGARADVWDNGGVSILAAPAKNGDRHIVKALLGAGANTVHPSGKNPLTSAVMQPDAEIVRMLLNAGADANGVGELDAPPLCCSVVLCYPEEPNPETVKLLLRNGADVNGVNKFGETPLLVALRGWRVNPEIVRLLLAAGANRDVEMTDKEAETLAEIERGAHK